MLHNHTTGATQHEIRYLLHNRRYDICYTIGDTMLHNHTTGGTEQEIRYLYM